LSICIGIPVKNESQNIPLLQKQLSNLIGKTKYNGVTFCICVNDNLSTDGSTEQLLTWQNSDNRVKVYKLLQPLDFQSSIQNLMKKTSADAFAILQSDLQDPITDFEKLLDTYIINQEHIVAGRAVTRKGSRFVNRVRGIFYWLLSSSSGANYVSGFQDFYILPKYVYSQIASLPSNRLFIRGFLYFNFTKIVFIDYQRIDRIFGESKFNFVKMYDLALDGLLLYGRRFIRILSITSFLIFICSLIFGIVILVMSFLGFDFGSKGWTSIILSISILVSILGMLAGVILEYLIRIYSRLNLPHMD
jgi:hypothetical protein